MTVAVLQDIGHCVGGLVASQSAVVVQIVGIHENARKDRAREPGRTAKKASAGYVGYERMARRRTGRHAAKAGQRRATEKTEELARAAAGVLEPGIA